MTISIKLFRGLLRGAIIAVFVGVSWCLWAGLDWLQDAYDVHVWLRARHLGLLVLAAELIAPLGRSVMLAGGAVLGVFVALLMPLPNPPLQATADPVRS